MKKLPPIDLTHSAHNGTTPHRKPTPRRAKRIKARKWRVISESLSLRKGGENTATLGDKGRGRTIATLDVSEIDALIEQVAVVIAGTSGTNLSDAEVAALCLASLGIIKRKHLPAIQAKRGKGKGAHLT